MRFYSYILILVLISSGLCIGQTEAVTNIRIRLDTMGRIRILYDLNWAKPSDSIYVIVQGKQSGPLTIRTVEGDIGKSVLAGRNKRVYWNIVKDGYLIDEEIQVSVLVKSRKQDQPPLPPLKTIGGGPANALLSALLPGVGNIFVQQKTKKHRIGFRPILPIVFYGLAGFSVYRWQQAHDQYGLYDQQIREDVAQPIYNNANDMRHQAILAAGAAATIWTIDVGCTLLKGISNNKRWRKSSQMMSFGVVKNVPVVGLTINL